MDQWEEILDARVPLATSTSTHTPSGNHFGGGGSRKRKTGAAGGEIDHDYKDSPPVAAVNPVIESFASEGIGVAWLRRLVNEDEDEEVHELPSMGRASKRILRNVMKKAQLGLSSSSQGKSEVVGKNDDDDNLWNFLKDSSPHHHHSQLQNNLFPIILNLMSRLHLERDSDHPVPIPTADLVQAISTQIQIVQKNNDNNTSPLLPLLPSSLDSMNAIYAALIFLATPISNLSPRSKHDTKMDRETSSPTPTPVATDPLDFFPPMPILEKNLPNENSTYPVSFSLPMPMSMLEKLDNDYADKLQALESFFWSYTCSSSEALPPSSSSSPSLSSAPPDHHHESYIYSYTPRLRNIPRVGSLAREESLLKIGEFKLKKVTRKRKKTATVTSSSSDKATTSMAMDSSETKLDPPESTRNESDITKEDD